MKTPPKMPQDDFKRVYHSPRAENPSAPRQCAAATRGISRQNRKKGADRRKREIHRALTVMLLRLRGSFFKGGGMSKETFDREYLSGLGRYERRIAREEEIEL